MKNFRSSKNLNLKQLTNLHSVQFKQFKQEVALKLKIKALEQQIQLLKKTNLNIYIPLSQKQVNPPQQNKDQLIKKLRIQILQLQQENQNQNIKIKRVQKQKQVLKIQYQTQIEKLQEQITQLNSQIEELKQQKQILRQKYQDQKAKKQQTERELIQLKVEFRFMKEDHEALKQKYQQINTKYSQLHQLVLNVQFNSRIYKSKQTKVTAIETEQLKQLKRYVIDLQKQIQQLLYKLSHPNKEQIVSLKIGTKNIGEEIVRLKKNIDLQLGLKSDQKLTNQFLSKYNQTDKKFKQLLQGCKPPNVDNYS